MNIRCEHLDDLLLEGDAFSMEAADRHAATCPACRQTLDEWKEISDTAKTLKTTWGDDLLWPRVERALKTAGAGEAGRAKRVWRFAAAAAITLTVGGTSWYTMRDTARDSSFDQKILRVAAIDEVERAEEAYLSAIDRLEKAAEPALQKPSEPLMVSYREKLMLLDDAIAECQLNIEQNRQNAHLRRQLLAMYSEKQRTLQAVVREEQHVSNP